MSSLTAWTDRGNPITSHAEKIFTLRNKKVLVFIGLFFLQMSFIVVWIKIPWKYWKIDNKWRLFETIHYHTEKWVRKYCCFVIYSHYCTYYFHLNSYLHGRQVGNTNTVIALLRDSYRLSGHMMTSSNGNIFRITSRLCGEFTGRRGEFPSQSLWYGALLFSLISTWITVDTQLWDWWFDTPSLTMAPLQWTYNSQQYLALPKSIIWRGESTDVTN